MTSVVQQDAVLSVDTVVQSVTNATKRLSQISTNTSNSSKRKKTQNKIGPWKLGRTLGRGSTGRVRLAKNVHTGKLAAIKIVPKLNFKKLENPKYKNNDATRLPYGIEREIIIMKLISHPNIMGLYDVWENKNDLYLILEYVEGGELFDYLIKRGKLLEFEAMTYFKQIIHGIGYLHQFNICHRDLKPENLLLDFNKNIKIADFGMAALEVDSRLLETSCGSPHYASPEIVAGKNYHGAPSDIWSCGIILFALLTGHLPFDDENIRKLLLKVQNGKFIMPNDLSWEAKDLILRMLQVNPADRILIEDILCHPLLTKYPNPSTHMSGGSDFILHSNIKPIQSVDRLDPEIVRNLCILFHNCPEDQVVNCLLSPRKSPEKMFYYLLMKYRNEHSSLGTSNYMDDDTDLTGSDSKHTLPRSTSVVKTTVTTQSGEQYTTIKTISQSLSATSSASSKKKALANITNTSFTASSSHKRKTLLSNTVISKNNSAMSLKSKRLVLAQKDHKPIQRKLTPSYIVLNQTDDKENQGAQVNPRAKEHERAKENTRAKEYERTKENTKEPTIQNFEQVCQDIFGSDADTQSIYNMSVSLNKSDLSRDTLNKLKMLNSRLSKASLAGNVPDMSHPSSRQKRLSSVQMMERKLAEEVQRKNDARERVFKESDAAQARKAADQKRQSIILREKLRQALMLLKESQGRNMSLPSSSLDPKIGINSLLRAKSLSTNRSSWNEKNTKVLQKLGIDVRTLSPLSLGMDVRTLSPLSLEFDVHTLSPLSLGIDALTLSPLSLGIDMRSPPPRSFSRSSSVVKTSTSKNLAALLHEDIDIPVRQASAASFKTDDVASFNSKEDLTIQLPLKKENTSLSIGYRSMLNVIDENNANVTREFTPVEEEDTMDEKNLTRLSVQSKPALIPNPRFSKISLNGLINSKFDSANFTIAQNTLSSGTVIKKSTRKQLATTKGKGMIRKSSTKELPGLGIVVHGNTSQTDLKSVTSMKSGDKFWSQTPSVQRESQTSRDESLTCSSTLEEDDYSLSDHLINMTQDFTDPDRSNNRSSNSSLIHTDTEAVTESHNPNDKLTQSKDTLVETNDTSIKSMYKSYETLYSDKRSKQKLSANESVSELSKHRTSFTATGSNVHILDSSSLMEDSQLTHESKSGHNLEDKVSSADFGHDESDNEEMQINSSMDASKHEDSIIPQRQGTLKSSMRRSHASTQIFSSLHLTAKLDAQPKATESTESNSRENTSTEAPKTMILEQKGKAENPGLLRKKSLNPKREAPKAPAVQNWGEPNSKADKRFSGMSIYSNAKKFVTPKEQKKREEGSSWFKRLFQSFYKSPKDKQTVSDRDVQVINTGLRSVDVMRIIKNQLKLKQIDGSVTNVEIDEEFALISGVVPTKYARGRKLYFKIEVLDLVSASSLHLFKIKGSRNGFNNLVEIVRQVVKQEEEATGTRPVSYTFKGRKK